MSLASQLDWVAKYRVVDGYRTKHDLRWDDARLRAMDLQYHDLRPHKALASRVGLQRLTTDDEVTLAVTEPPPDTRAWFRGKCLQRWASQIVATNWDSMVFDVGGGDLRVAPVPSTSPGEHTVMGFAVSDVDAVVAALSSRGVVFERFAGFAHAENGTVVSPDGAGVAWCRDPDGNMLSVVQFPATGY
jgi:proteasome accessory factor A